MQKIAYLDHASTSPTRDRAIRAMEPFEREIWANAASSHAMGLDARAALDKAREKVARLLGVGAGPGEIIFTSGGTESIVLSLIGAAVGNRHRGNHIITTSFEHHATHAVFEFLSQQMGFETSTVGIDHEGKVRLDELERSIRDDTILVSVMAVNNEIGTVQDIRKVVEICEPRGILVHSDFVQAPGKIPIDFHGLDLDLAIMSGHKFGGPKGTGLLYVKQGTQLRPVCPGSHEFGIRAGTVNLPGIVGLSVALGDAVEEMSEIVQRLRGFKQRLWEHVKSVAPEAEVNGSLEKSVESILNVRLPGCIGESLVLLLSRAGVMVSTASACQSESTEPSHVLKALGIDFLEALSSVRISMGYSTTEDEIELFMKVFPEVYERAKASESEGEPSRKGPSFTRTAHTDEMLRGIPRGSKVLIAMSGGVDSSIAASRLREAGMDVVGVTMHLASEADCRGVGEALGGERACCSIGAARDAGAIAEALGISHHVIDLSKAFQDFVINPTRHGYLSGRTPNPCVLCNRFIKFDVLFSWAEKLGCSHIATGHYARIVKDYAGMHLLRGVDPAKDQSYFLAYLNEAQLEKIVFPLGWDVKDSIREEARSLGLTSADREESQDLCFVAPGPQEKIAKPGEGEIVTLDGTIIGYHTGIEGYTRGQRKGLPGGQPEPIYVVDIDPASNRIIVGSDLENLASEFMYEDLSLVSVYRDRKRLIGDVLAQVRYRTRPIFCHVEITEMKSGVVRLMEPVRAITPGQIVVFYIDEEVLGGGTIERVER
jgi:cysteine desulfurase